MADDLPNEGWAYLLNARKWHYFRANGRSLCGKWLRFGKSGAEQGNNDSADNCAACRRKILTNIVPPKEAA